MLARELRQCYAAIALVTDMDAGVETGAGVGQEEVFALFAQNLDRLRVPAHRRHRRAARTRRAARARPGRTGST